MIKEDDPEEDAGIPAWIVSYADLVTLLFATFVVLYGLKPEGETKAYKGAASNIREAFMDVPDDIPTEEKRGDIILGQSKFYYKKGTTTSPPIQTKYADTEFPLAMGNQGVQKLISKLKLLGKKVKPKQVDDLTTEAYSISVSKNEVNLSLLNSVFFRPGSAEIDPENFSELTSTFATIAELGKQVHFEGHSSVSKGIDHSNLWKISSQRASIMAESFIKQQNFPRSKVSAAGFGPSKPVSEKSTSSKMTRNDRVEIHIHFDP